MGMTWLQNRLSESLGFSSSTTTIYCRSETGDDNNDGLTEETAVATLAEACERAPKSTFGNRVIIDVTDCEETLPPNFELPPWKGTEVTDDAQSAEFFLFPTSYAIQATPRFCEGFTEADMTVAQADLASSAAQTGHGMLLLTLNVARASWDNNALKGKFLVGANSLQNSIIIASTTTTLLVAQAASPGFTGTLRIMEPSAHFTTSITVTGINKGGLAARNVDSVSFNGLKITNATSHATAHGLELSGNGHSAVQMCEVMDPMFVQNTPNLCKLNRLWLKGTTVRIAGGWSLQCALIDAPTNLQFSAMGPSVGNFRRVAFIGAPPVRLCNSQFPGQTAVVAQPVSCFVGENVLIADTPGASGDGLQFHGVRGLLRNADIRNCGRDGIRVTDGVGQLELVNVLSTTQNTAYGLRVTDGMKCKVDSNTSGGAGNRLRGATGDMICGNLTTRTWSDFVSGSSGKPALNEIDLTAIAGTSGTFDDASAADAYITGTGSHIYQ